MPGDKGARCHSVRPAQSLSGKGRLCKPAPSRPEEAASPRETKTWEALFPGCRSSGKPDAEPNPASYREVLSLLHNVDGDRICCPLRVRTSPWHPHPKGGFWEARSTEIVTCVMVLLRGPTCCRAVQYEEYCFNTEPSLFIQKYKE